MLMQNINSKINNRKRLLNLFCMIPELGSQKKLYLLQVFQVTND